MKMFYITNVRLPTEKAHGLQIMENCSAFTKTAGLDVTLGVPRRWNKIHDDPFHYYALEPVFKIHRFWCMDLLFIPILKRFWFSIETITFTLSAWFYVTRHQQEIDLIYTREVSLAACLPIFKPLFYEVHNLPAHPSWLHRRAFARAKGIIVISEGLKNDLVNWGVASEKILVARDGVNIEKFNIPVTKAEARQRLNLLPDKFMAVYTGHLYSWKGADLLAQTGKLLPGSIYIYLVGGTDKDVARFRSLYPSDNIHIIGQRPQAEIPLWLKAADVLVLPNSAKEKISSHYTSPLKLFEYMASGTPIVAADLPSIREVVGKGEANFFEPDNVAILAKTINYVLNNEEIASIRAAEAKELVKKYSWEARARTITEFFNIITQSYGD